jgi:uncharacterized protein YbjT (DUF2867 family)
MAQFTIFVTGSTGYIGKRLIPLLIKRGHAVRALARKGSESRLPPNCMVLLGNALSQDSFVDQIQPADTFIQLIGVAHPSPSKVDQFKTIDLVSIRASVAAAVSARIRHFIYVSVAHPAPVMKEYIAVRAEGEALLKSSGLNATILRPWYVLGPGHRWPALLMPMYWVLERLPSTRESARRLGLVNLSQMLNALVAAVETPPQGVRILEVPDLKRVSADIGRNL